jgi:hypothetical protein
MPVSGCGRRVKQQRNCAEAAPQTTENRVSRMRAIEFAASPRAKRHKTNFTHKDSLPQQAFLFDDGSDEISSPPLEGEQKAASGRRLSYEERRCEASAMARSAAGGVTALTGARASGGAEHPTPPAGACHRAGHFGPDPLGGRPSPSRAGQLHVGIERRTKRNRLWNKLTKKGVRFLVRSAYAIPLPSRGG